MARNRESSDGGSLDMLLDTMCNTFGCLIFLAILLAIISREVAHSIHVREAGGVTTVESRRQEATIAALTLERESLQKILASQQKVHELKGPRDVDLSTLREESAILDKKLKAVKQQLEQTRERIISQKEETARKTAECEQIEKKLSDLKSDAEKKKVIKRNVRLPRLHAVKVKRSLLCGIKFRKFYTVSNLAGGATFDTSEVIATKKPGMYEIQLKPGAGQRVVKGAAPRGKLAKALATPNPGQVLVQLSVYPDSFAEFHLVRKHFLDRGFQYNWNPEEGPIKVVVVDSFEGSLGL